MCRFAFLNADDCIVHIVADSYLPYKKPLHYVWRQASARITLMS